MADVLRRHIQDFGFKHTEIARRASKLNQATTYRVVEGETQNPSLNSITGIIEAISLTDADAGVLYRKIGMGSAKPRLFVLPDTALDYETAKMEAQNFLDTGQIRDASHRVMLMFDLAENDDQLCETYEQAGIVYMGMGRWEEAQVNFEAADRHLNCDINDPTTPQPLIDRKHTLMTNIGSLMVKRKNISWGVLFACSVTEHPKVSTLNRGWGLLVLGEAKLGLQKYHAAKNHFEEALGIFEDDLKEIKELTDIESEVQKRWSLQAQGNIRWTKIHLLKSSMLLGDKIAALQLQEQEQIYEDIDPETSITAGLFYAENLPQSRRKNMLLRELKKRAKRNRLGEVLQRISMILSVLLFFTLSTKSLIHGQNQEILSSSDVVQISDFSDDTTSTFNHNKMLLDMLLHRGNTGRR